MKTQKLMDALKAFETNNLKAIVGGTPFWRVTGWWSPSPGVTYQDWSNANGAHICDLPDNSYPG